MLNFLCVKNTWTKSPFVNYSMHDSTMVSFCKLRQTLGLFRLSFADRQLWVSVKRKTKLHYNLNDHAGTERSIWMSVFEFYNWDWSGTALPTLVLYLKKQDFSLEQVKELSSIFKTLRLRNPSKLICQKFKSISCIIHGLVPWPKKFKPKHLEVYWTFLRACLIHSKTAH